MGTYTTNKNLFMPTVGEQGWGTLVNGNFETIDNFLKPITVSGSTYTFTGNQTGGSISATSITNSGTLTSTGKITANGGIGTTSLTTSSTITSTGKITGNGGIGTTSLTTSSTITSTGKITANGGIGCKALTATSISNSGNMTNTGTLTCTGKMYANGGIEGMLYGKRVGAPTTTKPKFWYKAITCNFTASLLHTNGSGTSTFTLDTTSFFSWDEIVNDDVINYTCTYTRGSSSYYMTQAVFTFTNVLTGTTTTNTVSLGNVSSKTFTLSAPLLSDIKVESKGNSTMWNTSDTSRIAITRSDVYLIPATL